MNKSKMIVEMLALAVVSAVLVGTCLFFDGDVSFFQAMVFVCLVDIRMRQGK